METCFSIPGNPTAQKRHRVARRGTFAGMYDPSGSDKADFLSLCMGHRPKQPVEGLVVIAMAFWMKVPTGKSKKFKSRVAERDQVVVDQLPMAFYSPLAHTKRPDIDNLIKFVLDALNGVYWLDDSQVQIRCAFKVYSNNPRTELSIYLENGEPRG